MSTLTIDEQTMTADMPGEYRVINVQSTGSAFLEISTDGGSSFSQLVDESGTVITWTADAMLSMKLANGDMLRLQKASGDASVSVKYTG